MTYTWWTRQCLSATMAGSRNTKSNAITYLSCIFVFDVFAINNSQKFLYIIFLILKKILSSNHSIFTVSDVPCVVDDFILCGEASLECLFFNELTDCVEVVRRLSRCSAPIPTKSSDCLVIEMGMNMN